MKKNYKEISQNVLLSNEIMIAAFLLIIFLFSIIQLICKKYIIKKKSK